MRRWGRTARRESSVRLFHAALMLTSPVPSLILVEHSYSERLPTRRTGLSQTQTATEERIPCKVTRRVLVVDDRASFPELVRA